MTGSETKETENNLKLNICSNYRDSFTKVYLQRNYVCKYTKQNNLWHPGIVNNGGFGKDNRGNFYNLFEPLSNQNIGI